MRLPKAFLIVVALLVAIARPALVGAAPARHVDYMDPASWLCLPGRADACTQPLTSTVVGADGSVTKRTYTADANAPVDCFYVYPTVSRDPGPNATMAIEPAEQNVVRQQLARFGAKCRLYAPMYRQHTLTALEARMTGRPMAAGDPMLAYNDVADAWREYLARDNRGRGVVLIGHSQGSGLLTQLIAREIDGKPEQARLVSAILMGTSLQVPPGADVGGSFKRVPLCHAASQVGCVIAFASFRADSPPPTGSFFGQGRPAEGTLAACVNPAALGGGSGELKAFMPAGEPMIAQAAAAPFSWTNPPEPIATPFVELPGLLSAACVSDAHGTWLAITLHPTPAGRRANDIPGDIVVGGQILKSWGLHLIDANLTIGNLVEVVGAQARAYRAGGG